MVELFFGGPEVSSRFEQRARIQSFEERESAQPRLRRTHARTHTFTGKTKK